MSTPLRHFLGLKGMPEKTLREILDPGRALQGRAQIDLVASAGRPDLGDDFHQVVDAHARFLRGGDSRTRRQRAFSQRERHAARPRRADQGHRARAGPHGARRDHPHLRAERRRGLRALRENPHDQRADRRRASVPDPGRHPDDRGKARADRGPEDRVHRRLRLQRRALVGLRGGDAEVSISRWPGPTAT